MKVIPLLEGELERGRGKKRMSRVVVKQVRLLLSFMYLVVVYASCINCEFKRAYDYVMKVKKTNDAPIKKSL